jgi:hypothetical protein
LFNKGVSDIKYVKMSFRVVIIKNMKNKDPLILIGIVIIFGLGALLYINNPDPIEYKIEKPIACSADAKACPDGSYVERVGPNCEFEPCPTASSTKNDNSYDQTIDPPDQI